MGNDLPGPEIDIIKKDIHVRLLNGKMPTNKLI